MGKVAPDNRGKEIIIQHTIGSMSQYLTVAQGMPKDIESLLISKTRKFIWDSGGKNTVNFDTLCAPMNQGGKNLLNIEKCNEAIELNWIKGLLLHPDHRPPCAYVAHAILAKYAQPSSVTHQMAHIDSFLQS